MDDLYNLGTIDTNSLDQDESLGHITEKDKLHAAKQILLGLALLYIFTVVAFLVSPVHGKQLIDIITISFPPLATLILASYFRDKNN